MFPLEGKRESQRLLLFGLTSLHHGEDLHEIAACLFRFVSFELVFDAPNNRRVFPHDRIIWKLSDRTTLLVVFIGQLI